jgi:hypothetical protein
MIRPVVELAMIDGSEAGDTVFSEALYGDHPYWKPIIDRLKSDRGVYLFFDSRGVAIYVGKAKKQSLWIRANQSFGAERANARGMFLADHPQTRVAYNPKRHRALKISEYECPLNEVASYFSAYAVDEAAIDAVEALLIRTHCNTLLNLQRGAKASLGSFDDTAAASET